jgi:type IV pilus assembly protein PilV
VIAQRQQRGMALIESLVAVLLLAIGLLGAIGLQARASSALADAGMRAEATMAANDLIGTIGLDVANASAYAVTATGTPGARLAPWHAATKARVPNSVITVLVTPNASPAPTRIEITIAWNRKKGTPQNSYRIVSYLAAST